MPSLITHDIFAKNLYKNLPISSQNNIKDTLNLYYLFAQSHDYLFYYWELNIKKAKQIRHLGSQAHKLHTQNYLINIIKNIKKYHLETSFSAIAYLYGSITHYVLDSVCHPYIFYKTGVYHKNNPTTYKYHGKHTQIEKDLDAILYKKYFKKEYKHCNVSKEFINYSHFSTELIQLINLCYKETYNMNNIGQYYLKSIKKTKLLYKLLINDRFGIKKLFYQTIDNLSHHKYGYLSAYSTHITNPNLDFLNTQKKEWNHPCIKDLKYNYSFYDLLALSQTKCLNIIEEIDKVLYQDKDIEYLQKIIPNISYSTGLPLEENKIMQYFEY